MNHISLRPRSSQMLIWLGGLLAALWTVTIATWMYDEHGYSFGMPGPDFALHLLAPLLVGLIVGWRRSGLWPGAKAGAIVGALFGAANIGAQLVWGAAIGGRRA